MAKILLKDKKVYWEGFFNIKGDLFFNKWILRSIKSHKVFVSKIWRDCIFERRAHFVKVDKATQIKVGNKYEILARVPDTHSFTLVIGQYQGTNMPKFPCCDMAILPQHLSISKEEAAIVARRQKYENGQ